MSKWIVATMDEGVITTVDTLADGREYVSNLTDQKLAVMRRIEPGFYESVDTNPTYWVARPEVAAHQGVKAMPINLDRMRTGIKRGPLNSYAVSLVDHLAEVREGEDRVFPICGAAPGTPTSPDTNRLCGRCERIAGKEDQ